MSTFSCLSQNFSHLVQLNTKVILKKWKLKLLCSLQSAEWGVVLLLSSSYISETSWRMSSKCEMWSYARAVWMTYWSPALKYNPRWHKARLEHSQFPQNISLCKQMLRSRKCKLIGIYSKFSTGHSWWNINPKGNQSLFNGNFSVVWLSWQQWVNRVYVQVKFIRVSLQ